LKENGVPGQRAEHTETVVGLSEESKTGQPRRQAHRRNFRR
jgi:hypothetical protein